MKQILLHWTYHCDIISVPDEVEENLLYYQMEFDNWISNKDNKHNYWVYFNPDEVDDDGPLVRLSFNSDAFINWLNDCIIKEHTQKANYVEKHIKEPTDEQKQLPIIYF